MSTITPKLVRHRQSLVDRQLLDERSLGEPGLCLIDPSREQTESGELLERELLVFDMHRLVHAWIANGGVQPLANARAPK